MNSLYLPVIDPVFEKLKRSGGWLHFTAGLLILTHAVSHAHERGLSPVYFWCQMIIALDIFILVFAGRNILAALPKINMFFRIVEALFFLGIGIMMLVADKPVSGIFHICLSVAYSWLFYCERNLPAKEMLSFHHTGLSIPGIPESKFLFWSHINQVKARYDSIHIETSSSKSIDFILRKSLDFEELEQIHEFCRHYLKIES